MTDITPLEHPDGWHLWPTPPDRKLIRDARAFAGLTQAQAAQLVHVTVRTWQMWEAGQSVMRPGYWSLFVSKARARMEAKPPD